MLFSVRQGVGWCLTRVSGGINVSDLHEASREFFDVKNLMEFICHYEYSGNFVFVSIVIIVFDCNSVL